MAAPPHLRPVTGEELPAYLWTMAVAFGDDVDDAVVAEERTVLPLDRTVAAFDGDRIVGTASSYPFALTVPGGAEVAVGGVSAVAVLPTHRRRGILRSMMAHQLDDLAGRGEVAAVLTASEAPIYRRFGYGVAQEHQALRLATARAALSHPPADRAMRMLTRAEARAALPALYDAHRRVRPGTVSRTPAWWGLVLGEQERWRGGGRWFAAVVEPEGGDPGGYVLYTLDELADDRLRVKVRELIAASPGVEAALWRFCAEIDLADEVEVAGRPLDDPHRWRLVDPRALEVVGQRDHLWARLLDVPTALAARAYPVDGTLTLEVADTSRPAQCGRYRLVAEDGRGACRRLGQGPGRPGDPGWADPPDVALDVADLGSLWLGGVDARALARAGRLAERTPGAVERAQALFSWPVRPMCTTHF